MADEAPARPMNSAKVAEFYNAFNANPSQVPNLLLLLQVAGDLVGLVFPQYAGLIAELESALKLFQRTANAPIPQLDQVFALLASLNPS